MAKDQQFKNIAFRHEKVEDALIDLGASEITKETVSDGLIQFRFKFRENSLLIKLFLNKNGKCTLGSESGHGKALFNEVAAAIVNYCQYSDKSRLEISIPRVDGGIIVNITEFLSSNGVDVAKECVEATYTLYRATGPHGDKITIKHYTNKTLQFQGAHAFTGALIWDFLRTVMPIEEILEQQVKVYKLPITANDAQNNLAARIPNAEDELIDEIRIQLASALALTKIELELEDYSVIAFPALRGLEGFCFQVLNNECRFKPDNKTPLGSYFEQAALGYALAPVYRDGVAQPLQQILAECYTMWHRIFHMDATVETSVIMDDRDEAVSLVQEVMSLVDTSFKIIREHRS